ncbi:unnamed protein product [Closterium sp. NIES-54]
MCSKCYTEHVAKTMQSAATASASSSSPRSSSPRALSPSTSLSSSTPLSSSSSPVQSQTAQPISQILSTGCAPSAPRVSSRVVSPSLAQPLDRQLPESRELIQEPTSRPHVTGSSSPAVSVAVPSGSAGKLAVSSSAAATAASCKKGDADSPLVQGVPAPVTAGPARTVNRCGECRRRVGLTGFKCRCEGLFCAMHRYSDRHTCTFDYKTAGREAIAQANPVVKADKVTRF